ncbi:hypothetical protein [Variovorax sp. HJSM1_2]|uniref:hypothetical protein n=1 Tax=Variovorax sp. HJSM1_2 TaxID=3366263 RepID=UPI003BED0056
MSRPVVEESYDDMRYIGLTVGSVAGVALVAAFLGTFIYMVLRSLARVLPG